MLKTLTVLIGLGGLGLALTTSASAQGLGGGYGGVSEYNPNPYSSPTVSPYLNLGVNPSNGLSNYQTLVRPLIDEREEIMRQTATLQQLQYQARKGRSGSTPKEVKGQDSDNERGGARHFMHYSHYFSGLR